MKDIFARCGRMVEDPCGLNKGPRELVGTIEEAAEVVTRGGIALVTDSFPTLEVVSYLLTPAPKESNSSVS